MNMNRPRFTPRTTIMDGMWASTVWVKRAGNWQAAYHQETPSRGAARPKETVSALSDKTEESSGTQAMVATKSMESCMISPDAAALEAELRAAMAEHRKASLAGDTERVASFMADEYLQTNVSGKVQDKSAWLAEYFIPYAALIKAGTLHVTYEDEDVRIRIFGDAAVVIGRGIVKVCASHEFGSSEMASGSSRLCTTHSRNHHPQPAGSSVRSVLT